MVVTVVATGLELRTKEGDSELAKQVLEKMQQGHDYDDIYSKKSSPRNEDSKTKIEQKPKSKSGTEFPSWIKGKK